MRGTTLNHLAFERFGARLRNACIKVGKSNAFINIIISCKITKFRNDGSGAYEANSRDGSGRESIFNMISIILDSNDLISLFKDSKEED